MKSVSSHGEKLINANANDFLGSQGLGAVSGLSQFLLLINVANYWSWEVKFVFVVYNSVICNLNVKLYHLEAHRSLENPFSFSQPYFLLINATQKGPVTKKSFIFRLNGPHSSESKNVFSILIATCYIFVHNWQNAYPLLVKTLKRIFTVCILNPQCCQLY